MHFLFIWKRRLSCRLLVAPTEPTEPVSWFMDFPGLSWGMTTEEACTALELTDIQQDTKDYRVLHNIRMTVFGAENADVYLYFGNSNGDSTWSLYKIMAIHPYNTDMEAMARQIEAHYGIAPELTEQEQLDYYGEPMTAKRWIWESDALLQDIMSEYDSEFVLAQDKFYHRILTDPATTITLDGMHTRNLLTISSLVTFYNFEGGYRAEAEAAVQTE